MIKSEPFSLRLLIVASAACVVAGCVGIPATRTSVSLSACTVPDTGRPLLPKEARGIRIDLPADAVGPSYDSDDYSAEWPTWAGARWSVHLVYGSGGLTRFMKGARCCVLDDNEMHRQVCIGEYMRYGAMADISRVSSPTKISSAQLTIQADGMTEPDALRIVSSMVTTWEQ